MKSGNLTLERILGPDPVPEFRYCSRCNVEMNVKRTVSQCLDCERLPLYRPRGVQGKYMPPYHPDFDISVHYDKVPNGCPTLATLEALDLAYVLYVASRGDSFEVDWAKALPTLSTTKGDWPIVVLSSHGKVIDFWHGFNLNKLNALPFTRAAIISTPSVHDSQEQAA